MHCQQESGMDSSRYAPYRRSTECYDICFIIQSSDATCSYLAARIYSKHMCTQCVATNLILRVLLFVVSPCSLLRLCELSEDTKHPLWFELPLSVRARTAGAHRLRVLKLVESPHKLLVLAHRQYEVKLARALRLRCLRRKPGHTTSKCGVGRAAWRQNGADSGRSRDIVRKDQEGVRAWNYA